MSTSVQAILAELRNDNGSNFKMDVLKRHSGNELLKAVLKLAYDKVAYTFGISMKHIRDDLTIVTNKLDLGQCVTVLIQEFATRKVTGNAAKARLEAILANTHPSIGAIVVGIINRDLRINMGRSNINKVFPGLIVKPVYMRCGVYSEDKMANGKLKKGTCHKVNPKGAYTQLKADGTYREFTVDGGVVSCNSRSGEEYEYPVLFGELQHYVDGKYIGELTVKGVPNRAEANGMINSSKPPHDKIMLQLWDYVTLVEYANAAEKIPNTTPYAERLRQLNNNWTSVGRAHISLIPTKITHSIQEALKVTGDWMKQGYEGSIYKDKDAVFRDGTSLQQLKLKLEINLDVRITGFTAGTKGTSREATFGAITFTNDEGTIVGQTSGFSNAQLTDFNSRRDELIGSVMEVQCNDLTKGRDNEHHALSHPRFIELRPDKNTTDTLERALELRDLAMMLDA